VKPLLAAFLLAAAPVLAAETAKTRTADTASNGTARTVTLRSVTMDVKDAEARDVLRWMQKQCGIKNMLIDREVDGMKGATFKFTEVPCDVAFRVVFRTYGLAGQFHQSSVVTVDTRR
jgi:hypothetical protein